MLFEPADVPPPGVPSFVETASAMIPIPTESGPAVGYYIEVGFRCQPGDVVDVIDFAAADGEIHWGRSEWYETHIDALPRKVRGRVAFNHDAFWYRGEREYFRRW
jgi:hypothetical protein